MIDAWEVWEILDMALLLPSCRQNQSFVVIGVRVDLLRIEINGQRIRKFPGVTAAMWPQPREHRREEWGVRRLRTVIERQPLNAVSENSDFVNRAGFLFTKELVHRVGVGQKVGRVGILA